MAGHAPLFWRALRSALEVRAGDKLRPTDEQLVGMSWRLAREACGLTPPLTPPLMDGYCADGPLDDLRLPQTLPPGAGQAAQKFLREHWQTTEARPWYNIAKNIDEDTGMSGELGLPNSSQHDCRLCLRCIRREACAAVGKSAEAGFITQKAATGKGGHLKSKAHERATQEYARKQQAVSAARDQAHRQGAREGGQGLLRKQRKRREKNKRRPGRTKDVLSGSLLDGASTCTELTEENMRARTRQRARVGVDGSAGTSAGGSSGGGADGIAGTGDAGDEGEPMWVRADDDHDPVNPSNGERGDYIERHPHYDRYLDSDEELRERNTQTAATNNDLFASLRS
jgi:hypothetical protein